MSNRYELKYLLRWNQYQNMLNKLTAFTRPDGYARNGKYKIVSLYYDTKDLKFYWEKVDGYDNRLKVRLRFYDDINSQEQVFLEIKQKDNQTIIKRRTQILLRDAYALLDRTIQPDAIRKRYSEATALVAEEVLYLSSIYQLAPKVVVTYYRQPFVGLYDPRLRITFDSVLRYYDGNNLFSNTSSEYHIIHPEFVILEIKVAEQVPAWLVDFIGTNELIQQRASKYCLAIERLSNKHFFSV